MTAVLELQEVLSVDCISHQTPSLELLESLGPQCEVLLHLGSELLRLQVGLGDYAGVLSTAEAGLIGITLLIDWPAAEAAVEAIPHAADIPVEEVPPKDEDALDAILLQEEEPRLERWFPAFEPAVCLEKERVVPPSVCCMHRHPEGTGQVRTFHHLLLFRTDKLKHLLHEVRLVAPTLAHGPQELSMSLHESEGEAHQVG
mmetsp:Transcript_67912/g.147930  ORF Transcript_67912/g.147930 Transcript_67912/m.147930 type:complete len:201 (+) Transcript_67912:319-921(+)